MTSDAAQEAYLVVWVGSRPLALAIETVLRVAPRVATTPLVHALAGVEGLIRFAESVVPVLDVRSLIGLGPALPKLDDRLVLAQVRGQILAIHADLAAGVIAVPAGADERQRAERVTSACVTQCVIATTDGVVQILDLATALGLAQQAVERASLLAGGEP